MGSLVAAHGLLSCGMHVGSSSLTRDRTHVPCFGRQILNHSATREVPLLVEFWMSVEGFCLNCFPSALPTGTYVSQAICMGWNKSFLGWGASNVVHLMRRGQRRLSNKKQSKRAPATSGSIPRRIESRN